MYMQNSWSRKRPVVQARKHYVQLHLAENKDFELTVHRQAYSK